MLDFDPYIIGLLGIGLTMVGGAWLPQLLLGRHASVPLLHIGMGALLFGAVPDFAVPNPFSEDGRLIWEKLTEFVVLISLLGAGLKIDRVGKRAWLVTGRLLLVTMPLTIASVAFLGWAYAGMTPAVALLLGAALAPTDPVLAGDVQTGAPNEGDGDNVRFALTSEAGLNDGLAFPFTYLAVGAALYGFSDLGWTLEWALMDGLYRTVAGAGMGWLVGRALALLIFKVPAHAPLAKAGMGFVAVSIVLVAYGAAEVAEGYGFIAVFVAAFVVRRRAYRHKFQSTLFTFTEDLENAVVAVLLVLLGGIAVVVLPLLTLEAAAVGLALLIVLRPLAGLLGLAGGAWPFRERAAIGFFGIRGIGSIYYLSYATGHADFGQTELLWATVVFTIVVSAALHGLTALPVMRYIGERAAPAFPDDPEEQARQHPRDGGGDHVAEERGPLPHERRAASGRQLRHRRLHPDAGPDADGQPSTAAHPDPDTTIQPEPGSQDPHDGMKAP